jgi:uncharacterized phage-associated protein
MEPLHIPPPNPERERERDKLMNVMLYLAWREQDDPRFGETKFNKLLFFANAYCFGDTGNPLTTYDFHRQQYGPTLRHFLPLKRQLEEVGAAVTQEREFMGRSQKRLVPLRRPDLSALTAEEVAVIDEVIRRFWEKNGTDMSEFAHELPAWKSLPNGEAMRPGSVFITRRNLTEREMAHALTLKPSAPDAVVSVPAK